MILAIQAKEKSFSGFVTDIAKNELVVGTVVELLVKDEQKELVLIKEVVQSNSYVIQQQEVVFVELIGQSVIVEKSVMDMPTLNGEGYIAYQVMGETKEKVEELGYKRPIQSVVGVTYKPIHKIQEGNIIEVFISESGDEALTEHLEITNILLVQEHINDLYPNGVTVVHIEGHPVYF